MLEFTDRVSVEKWCEGRTPAEISAFAAMNAALIYPHVPRSKN